MTSIDTDAAKISESYGHIASLILLNTLQTHTPLTSDPFPAKRILS